MKKIMTFTAAGILIMVAGSAHADRVQYSIEQASSLSNSSNNNLSITFSHKAVRNPGALTAADSNENSTPSTGGGHTGGVASPTTPSSGGGHTGGVPSPSTGGGHTGGVASPTTPPYSGGHTGSVASPTDDDRFSPDLSDDSGIPLS